MVSGLAAVILESSWRMAPAAALRGLAKGGFPSASCRRLSSSKFSSVMNTSPRGSRTSGGSSPSLSGMARTVRMFWVTSSPTIPLPRVAQRDREPVYLQLRDVAEPLLLFRAEEPPDAGVPLPQVLGLAGVR